VGIPFAVLIALGLLATYSRGALLAAGAGLLALVLLIPREARRLPQAALSVLVLAGAVSFADPTFRQRALGEGTVSWYAASCRPEDDALALRPDESRPVRLVVTNTGRMPWQARRGFMPAYRLRDAATGARVGEGFGPWVAEDVPPGEERRFTVIVHAPTEPGRFVLCWDMVHVHAGWFAEHGSRPAWVTLDVTPDGSPRPDPRAPVAPAALAPDAPPSRRQLWTAALALWRQRPLVGVGPDNFRRLYGRTLGVETADPRTHANNTLLEAAATTGVLGALALAVTLLGALRAAARGTAPAAPALCGLGVVLAVHGLVDYVLAFTGHALVLAFVAGAASARDRPAGDV
jgi:hypothetical protein